MGAEPNIADIDRIVEETGRAPDAVIPILRKIQGKYGYLPEAALRRVCEITRITPAAVAGVSTFYSHFRHRPAGRHLIRVCVGTACHVKGSERVVDAVRRYLEIPEGDDTDRRRIFTVASVACLGCCTLAPAVQIDDTTYGHLTPGTVDRMIGDFLDLQASKDKDRGISGEAGPAGAPAEIRIGQGTCCMAGGSLAVRRSLERAVQETGAQARIKVVGCVGMCHQTPLVEVVDRDGASSLYAKVRPEEAERIVRRHFRPQGLWNRVRDGVTSFLGTVFTDETWEPVTRYAIHVRDPHVEGFLGRQKHIAAEHCGYLNPLDLDEYQRNDGFQALQGVLDRNEPERVIEEISASGLRGRGGAGFPTGRKWALVRAAKGPDKVAIMNGDEGDPGAFMDRMIMESYPYRVLEGMTIAAFTVGARSGVLYIRSEYPLALERMQAAIDAMVKRNFLGKNILGSGFDFQVRIVEGAGAFVCGEETALLQAVEGKRGMPRFRPPFPASSGLNGLPTLVNNVETYACIPWILRRGPEAFAAMGSGQSRGTKVFSLTGKVRRGGLIEVPMGITIREIVMQIGGGVAEGRTFKAVQIGGPSGGCIPASLADTAVDYEALAGAGAIMGSGGLVVMDDTDCMVDIALYFLRFTQDQSCGKCTFCRVGTKRMLEILERLCGGRARPEDIANLEELSGQVTAGSLCGLGRTAPNPVLTTLRYFRHEYEAHVAGTCPARKCKALIRYSVNDRCIGCTKCAQGCPADAIAMRPYEKHEIDTVKCVRCGTCADVCPVDAVEILDPPPAGKAGP
jgi:NADH-quinone oxidoreductase subunit F